MAAWPPANDENPPFAPLFKGGLGGFRSYFLTDSFGIYSVHLKIIFILALIIGFASSGCSIVRHLDGSSEEEMKKFHARKNELADELAKLKFLNQTYQQTIKEKENEIARCNKQETVLNKEVEDLKGRIQDLKGQAKDEVARTGMEESSLLTGQPSRRKKNQVTERHRQDEMAKLEKDRVRAYKEEAMIIPKDELWQQIKYFKFLNQTYQKTIKDKENELAQCNSQRATLNQKVETLRVQFQELKSRKDEAARMAMERKPPLAEPSIRPEMSQVAVKGKPEETARIGPETKITEAVPKTPGEKKAIVTKPSTAKSVKIKVLSGDGKLPSARKMAKRLIKMGYKVQAIDLAPRSNIKKNMVFYSEDCRQEAEQILKRLGGKTVIKPLSWPSVFNLIVVTGN
jgi:phage shock protein A